MNADFMFICDPTGEDWSSTLLVRCNQCGSTGRLQYETKDGKKAWADCGMCNGSGQASVSIERTPERPKRRPQVVKNLDFRPKFEMTLTGGLATMDGYR